MPSDAELAQGINAFVADLPSGTDLVSLKDARRHLEDLFDLEAGSLKGRKEFIKGKVDSALAEREPQAKPPAKTQREKAERAWEPEAREKRAKTTRELLQHKLDLKEEDERQKKKEVPRFHVRVDVEGHPALRLSAVTWVGLKKHVEMTCFS